MSTCFYARAFADMFPEAKVRTDRIVDMFLTSFLQTGTKDDYLFPFLVPCGNGSIDVAERHMRPSEVPEAWAFRAFGIQRRRDDLTA